MEERRCPDCGHILAYDVRPLTMRYKDHSITVDMPGEYCSNCGEGVISGKDNGIWDRTLNRLKAMHEGLLLPEDIRKIRKKLDLTQNEAGILVGGGRNAFQLYESGIRLPSLAISNLLRLLEANPASLSLLRQSTQGDASDGTRSLAHAAAE